MAPGKSGTSETPCLLRGLMPPDLETPFLKQRSLDLDTNSAARDVESVTMTVSLGDIERLTSGRGDTHTHHFKRNTHSSDGTPQYDHGKQRFDISASSLRQGRGFARLNMAARDFPELGEAGPTKVPAKDTGVSYSIGVMYIVISTIFFSLAAVTVKLNSSMPSVETGTLRSVYSLVFGTILCYMVYGQSLLPFQAGGFVVALLICRGFVDFIASNLYYFGCTQLGLGFATVILFTNPFWAALIGRVWLKEPYVLSDFLLACVAFFGVVLSAWPNLRGAMSIDLVTIIIVLPCAIFQALTYCFIKRISSHVHYMQMTVAYGLCGFVTGPSIMTYGVVADQPLAKPAPLEVLGSPHVMMLGLGVALLAIAAQVFLNLGCASLDASIAALIRTLDIPLALIFERLVFGQQSEWVSIIGAAIVFSMSMLGTVLKQLRVNKEEDIKDKEAEEKEENEKGEEEM